MERSFVNLISFNQILTKSLNIKLAVNIHCFRHIKTTYLRFNSNFFSIQCIFCITSHTVGVWILFMTFIICCSGNHFYYIRSFCCYGWVWCTFSHYCLRHLLANTLPCIPCALSCLAQLHNAFPVVIKVGQLDSANRGSGDLISIDNYLKLI